MQVEAADESENRRISSLVDHPSSALDNDHIAAEMAYCATGHQAACSVESDHILGDFFDFALQCVACFSSEVWYS